MVKSLLGQNADWISLAFKAEIFGGENLENPEYDALILEELIDTETIGWENDDAIKILRNYADKSASEGNLTESLRAFKACEEKAKRKDATTRSEDSFFYGKKVAMIKNLLDFETNIEERKKAVELEKGAVIEKIEIAKNNAFSVLLKQRTDLEYALNKMAIDEL